MTILIMSILGLYATVRLQALLMLKNPTINTFVEYDAMEDHNFDTSEDGFMMAFGLDDYSSK